MKTPVARFSVPLALLLSVGLSGCDYGKKTNPNFPDGQITYYEMTVKLERKKTGERIDVTFPFVCGVYGVTDMSGSSFGRAERYPRLYGYAFRDGSGVAIKTPPGICANSKRRDAYLKNDFLPLILETLDTSAPERMTVHLSRSSFDSEYSDLSFYGAKIREVEFPTERQRRVDSGFIPDELLESSRMGPKNKLEYLGTFSCHASLPIIIPEGITATVNDAWPLERPRYWVSNLDGNPGKLPGMVSEAFRAKSPQSFIPELDLGHIGVLKDDMRIDLVTSDPVDLSSAFPVETTIINRDVPDIFVSHSLDKLGFGSCHRSITSWLGPDVKYSAKFAVNGNQVGTLVASRPGYGWLFEGNHISYQAVEIGFLR